jgi:pilus assembly protein Flp/PilA
MDLVKRFLREEEGLETVEYAVMGALILGVVITAVALLGGNVATRLTDVANTIATPATP